MTSPAGPIFTGRFEEYVIEDESGNQYTILFLPDKNNDQIQSEGGPAYYYYIPEQVRLAQKGDVGDFKFRHIHFVGTFDKDTNIGTGDGEVQGGVLSFTTTSRYPTSVMKQAQEQLMAKWNGKTDAYWGLRSRATPQFGIAPIVSNQTIITNLTPNPDGTVPVENAGGGTTGGGTTGGGEAPLPGGGGAPPRTNGMDGTLRLRHLPMDGAVQHGRSFRDISALDAWAWRMEGQGPGSITGGENAFSALLGPLPSEIVWAGFHGAYSPIVVAQNLQLQIWSQRMRIKIVGNWDRIFEHFSAAANASYRWVSADIKAEFNNLRINGGIQVEIDIDGTVPGASEMEKAIQARIDTIVNQFMEEAKKVIFVPAPPDVKPAEASSGGILSSLFGYGGGFALKYRRDSTRLNLNYEETRNFRYLQPHTISSSLEGFYNAIKNDPDAERKYFQRLVLGELGRKVHRIVKPVANFPDRSQGWAGDPIAFLSAQVGYPDSQGGIQWKQEIFQASDPPDRAWEPVFVMWRDGEVSNPPANWNRDETFIRRKVHLLEPPGEDEYPFMKVYVEQNEIELDPDPMANPTNDGILEVRADNAGTLTVGPMAISAVLESSAQVVEVELRVLGTRANGTDRSADSIRFRWNFDDQDEPRYLKLFTGQLDFVPDYEYRVHVTVKGTLFSKGMAWSGPWTPGNGNGPLMVQVPAPGDPGVVSRSLTEREMASNEVVRVVGMEEEPVPAPVPSTPPSSGGVPAPRSMIDAMSGAPAPRTVSKARHAEIDREERTIEGYEVAPPPAPSRGKSRATKAVAEGKETSKPRAVKSAPRSTAREEPEGYVES